MSLKSQTELNTWAAKLQKEVCSEWINKYPHWEPAFKVFYGPVQISPKLMIISLQPGGDKKNFDEEDSEEFAKGNFSVPEENTYIKSTNRFAAGIKNGIFLNSANLLKESVIIPLIFWRAKNYTEWKREPSFKSMEDFSFKKVREVIEKVKPQKILVLGLSTGRKLKELYPGTSMSVTLEKRGKQDGNSIAEEMNINGIPCLALIHPSRSSLTKADMIRQRAFFENWVSKKH
jgi:uracil-DNA glycosylase